MNRFEDSVSKLSVREKEVLEAAVEGLTDQQIALKLAIMPATVNSYWVRIRGKLGHFSRTELVASSLRSRAQEQINELKRQISGEQLRKGRFAGDYFRVCFDALPEAVFISDQRGIIEYVNCRFEQLFASCAADFVGADVEFLFPSSSRTVSRTRFEQFLANPVPIQLGIDAVMMGISRKGQEFRMLMSLDSRRCEHELKVVGLIRTFLDDVKLRRKSVGAYGKLS